MLVASKHNECILVWFSALERVFVPGFMQHALKCISGVLHLKPSLKSCIGMPLGAPYVEGGARFSLCTSVCDLILAGDANLTAG